VKIIVIIVSLSLNNRFVLIVNFRNRFDKALRKIFQFRRALFLATEEKPNFDLELEVERKVFGAW